MDLPCAQRGVKSSLGTLVLSFYLTFGPSFNFFTIFFFLHFTIFEEEPCQIEDEPCKCPSEEDLFILKRFFFECILKKNYDFCENVKFGAIFLKI